MKSRLAAFLIAMLVAPAIADAHPHIFADATIEVTANKDGTLGELRNVWRFDDVFSSSVLLDFDTNTDLKLDHDELEEISKTIRTSLADYDYFTFITRDGAPVKIGKPDHFHADFKDNKLLLVFSLRPVDKVPLKGKFNIGIYDPTLYTAIDFNKDEDMKVEGKLLKACKRSVIRPDPDKIFAQNQNMQTESFFNDPGNTDIGKLFATRLEMTC